jgi:hypothetical protein
MGVRVVGEANETDQRSRYVGLCGLFVFYYRLFKPNLDKKFFKTLYQVHKKVRTTAALLVLYSWATLPDYRFAWADQLTKRRMSVCASAM